MKEIECTVSGRVQGVFYRDTTRQFAEALGVTGFVENMRDGTVHVVAQGSEKQLTNFIEQLKTGSSAAQVEDIDVSWREPQQQFSSFEIRH